MDEGVAYLILAAFWVMLWLRPNWLYRLGKSPKKLTNEEIWEIAIKHSGGFAMYLPSVETEYSDGTVTRKEYDSIILN